MRFDFRFLLLRAVPVLLAFLLCGPALAAPPELRGPVVVVDGDTLVMGTARIRLSGIDAPETDQVCLDAASRRWACGLEARDRLAARIGRAEVTCARHGTDAYGRTLASCRAGGDDLQDWMVRQGLALAFVRYSHAYDDAEAAARRSRTGLWAGAFVAPWDWRDRSTGTTVLGAVSVPVVARPALLQPGSAEAAPDAGCVIKGNVNRQGERIYHRPGQSHYADTRMDKGAGERWFCSEQEAQAAGWRPARR